MLQLYYKKYRIKNNKCKITNFLEYNMQLYIRKVMYD